MHFFREGEWNTIDNESLCEDMNRLLNFFHDFELFGVSYEDRSVSLDEYSPITAGDNELTLRFLGTSLKGCPVIELAFYHVDKYRLSYVSSELNEIYHASVFCQESSANEEDKSLMVWLHDDDWEPDCRQYEQATEYVAAQTLKWRWLNSESYFDVKE